MGHHKISNDICSVLDASITRQGLLGRFFCHSGRIRYQFKPRNRQSAQVAVETLLDCPGRRKQRQFEFEAPSPLRRSVYNFALIEFGLPFCGVGCSMFIGSRTCFLACFCFSYFPSAKNALNGVVGKPPPRLQRLRSMKQAGRWSRIPSSMPGYSCPSVGATESATYLSFQGLQE